MGDDSLLMRLSGNLLRVGSQAKWGRKFGWITTVALHGRLPDYL